MRGGNLVVVILDRGLAFLQIRLWLCFAVVKQSSSRHPQSDIVTADPTAVSSSPAPHVATLRPVARRPRLRFVMNHFLRSGRLALIDLQNRSILTCGYAALVFNSWPVC